MSASTFLKILGPASAILLAACASQPATTLAPSSVAEAAPRERPYCLRSTGTLLAVPEGKCVIAGGRVITREELDRSGGINLTDALNRIAPF